MSQKYTKEAFSDALTEFDRDDADSIPDTLEEYLLEVAKTGETQFPWPRMAKLFKHKLNNAINEFSSDSDFNMDKLAPVPNVENVTFDVIKQRILAQIDSFIGVPFTIQRLCEMVTKPRSHYKRVDKFLRAVEKNVNVVTTVDPLGKKVLYESSKPMINGETDTSLRNLPPTYSAAPWAPAATVPASPWARQNAPLLHNAATNGVDSPEKPTDDSATTVNKPNDTTITSTHTAADTSNSQTGSETLENETEIDSSNQSETSKTDLSVKTQSESIQEGHVTSGSGDVTHILSGEAVAAEAAEAVAMDTERSCSTDSVPSGGGIARQSPSVAVEASVTMDASETAPELASTRPGKRESTEAEEGLVSPAKRMCLEKDGAITAEAAADNNEAVESNGADHTANDKAESATEGATSKVDDVTSTAEVTNGEHVQADEVTTENANDTNEVTQSEDSNDSEALTTSSEDSAAEQQPTGDVTTETDDVTAGDDDASKDGGGGEVESAEDTSNQ